MSFFQLESRMGIFSRITDIVNSNLNSILDRAEDPEKMVRLIIQEMEDTLVEVRTTTARAIAEQKQVERHKRHAESEVSDWERKAQVAVDKGRDDLAKAALLEKRRASEKCQQLAAELKVLAETLDKLSSDTQGLQAKLKDAKARQKSISIRAKTARTQIGIRRRLGENNVNDALERFEQYERKLDDLEGEVNAYDLAQRTLSEQIDELEVDEELSEELAELKSRRAQSTSDASR